jgi:hypothetical protein
LRPYTSELAPRAGLEPATLRLTAGCSAIELPRIGRGRKWRLYHRRHRQSRAKLENMHRRGPGWQTSCDARDWKGGGYERTENLGASRLVPGARDGCDACNREQRAPVAESQAATPVQATNQPTTVKGCLRAGEAADTYVLTGERTAKGEQTATYELSAAPGVTLAAHVGRQVEVSGVIVAQQEVTTRTTAQPAEKAAGTSATPSVSTSTELQLRKLTVHQVRQIDDSCPDEKDDWLRQSTIRQSVTEHPPRAGCRARREGHWRSDTSLPPLSPPL